MKEKPKTGILQRFFKIICLAVTLTSVGFLIYHMVYFPMENKKLVAELKGNFPEPEAPRITIVSPFPTDRLTSRSICLVPKDLLTCSTLIKITPILRTIRMTADN